MDRRTVLLGSAGLMAGCFLPTRVLRAQGWPPQVRQFVRDYQEREYLRLADALGLPSARSAYEKIANRTLPADLDALTAGQTLPTPYEDPVMYPILMKTFDLLSRESDALGARPLPRPFLATLASGDVEARATAEPTSKTPVVFFEHGLFSFFLDFAKLLAWAAPTLTEAQLTDDEALARIPRKYTMPLRASENFVATFHAYAVGGSPMGERSPIPEPTHNLGLLIRLLNHMERFVLGHELAHIREQHLSERAGPSHELEADALSVSLVSTLAERHHGSWALGYWGAELAVIALNLLYRAIGVYTQGTDKLVWNGATHPDPLTRRDNLRGIWLNPQSPKAGVAAAREMSGMTEALVTRLWDIGAPMFLVAHQRGERASPRWRKTAQHWQAGAGGVR